MVKYYYIQARGRIVMEGSRGFDLNVLDFSGILNKTADLIKDSYVFITDTESDITYITDKAAQYFNIKEQFCHDFYNKFKKYVNPYDIEEYEREMSRRINGEALSEELWIQFKHKEEYYMFEISAGIYKGQNNKGYFVASLKNMNVAPEIDALTDLFGRVRFEKDMDYNIKIGRKTAVIEVEIDHLNDIKMVYGSKFADRLQKNIAMSLIYKMDRNSAVYRLENSNLVFVLRYAGRSEALSYIARIRKLFENDIEIDGTHFELKCYAGGILLDDYDCMADEIISRLEYTLARSKEKKRIDIVFFNDLVRVNGGNDMEILKVIHQSVLNGCDGFFVVYQTIVNADTGKIAGAEALIRWKKEPYGVVSPGLFIDWIEENPCMYELGNFILESAIKDSVYFLKENPDFFININVSAKQLERLEFKDFVLDILKKYNFPANHLCLEITERCRELPVKLLRKEIMYMQVEGIHFAMDDYGTGSSSASTVIQVPFNEIKIDMSFVTGITENKKQQAMVKQMIDFGNDAGLNTCVEGIDSEEVQDYIRKLNPTWMQGYLYSKPVAADDLIKLL